MVVTRVIISMLQKADNFTKILDATTKECEFCKFWFQMASFSLNAVFYVS